MSWTIPAKSLNAATVAASGAVIDLDEVLSSHSIEVVLNLTTANQQPSVWFFGSLDGVNFYSLNTPPSTAIYTVPASSPTGLYIASATVLNQPARYIQSTVTGPAGCATVTTLHTSS